MQFIAKDEQSFRKVREMNGVYVDKTQHINKVFKEGTYFFMARPRRFGKSLLCSTLAELFAGNRELFKGLWIDGLESTWEWEKYPVLHLDMTNTVGQTAEAVEKNIASQLLELANNFNIIFACTLPINEMLRQLVTKIYSSTGKQVVLIIDEYDKPLLDVLQHDKTLIEAVHDVLKLFYAPLKPLSPCLKFVFITGVYKFAKTSIFSTLNNLNDISFDIPAGELVGYTEQEIERYFSEHRVALAATRKETLEECMQILRSNFNGYHFGIDVNNGTLSQSVYNPFALNYVFSKQQLIDEWFASGVPTSLVKTIAYEELQSLDPYCLHTELKILKTSCAPGAMSTLTMLYYAGYVTMKSAKNYVRDDKSIEVKVDLAFPNVATSHSFTQLLLPLVLAKDLSAIDQLARKTYRALADQMCDQLQELLNDYLAPISYLALKKSRGQDPHENLYQVAFYGLFVSAGAITQVEDATNQGRMDLSVHLAKTIYIFELKMDQAGAVAIQQIKQRDYAAKYRHQGKKIYAIGINLSSEKRKINELVWEAL